MATTAARWLALASTLTAATAVDTKRKVDTLPVYGAPPTAHWTGFVETDAASGSHLFYYNSDRTTSNLDFTTPS